MSASATPPRTRPRRRPRRHGLTFVELLLAMAVTVVIGAAIAAILFATTRASGDDRDLRALVARDKRAQSAAAAAARTALRVLDADATRLVFWYADDDDDGLIDQTELRFLAYDADDASLVWYTPDPPLLPFPYDPGLDFGVVADLLIGLDQVTPETWATGVTALSFTLDDADPAEADLVSFRLSMRAGVFEHEAIAAVSRRRQ